MLRRMKRKLNTSIWMNKVKWCALQRCPENKKDVVLFDPALYSANLGDSIIEYYCDLQLREIVADKRCFKVPTHQCPNPEEFKQIQSAATKIVCGTNLMTPHYEEFSNWKMPEYLRGYKNIVTLGVGWGYYCPDISKVSKFVYQCILSKDKLHSVRDSYTEQKFHEMGITNVINTGCPTIWNLTPELCSEIPTSKTKRVITTLTDYAQNNVLDKTLFDLLFKNYEEVYVWIQGNHDYEYLCQLVDVNRVHVVERSLQKYTDLLKEGNIDYVGTRLHAGIHALNHKIRTVIIAVDNRAIEMGKDFHLPVIERINIENQLENLIRSELEISISLPVSKIETWKKQFENEV